MHAARLHHRYEYSHVMQLEAAFDAIDIVHTRRPITDIEMDIT